MTIFAKRSYGAVFFSTSLTALSAAWGVAAWAAADEAKTTSTIEEVIVTARKKVENIQRIPVAVTAMGMLQLEQKGIDSFDKALNFIPNANMGGGIGGTLQGQFGIRGISTLVRIIGVETGIGIYVDGVFIGRPETYNQELVDIERIEVLRGPQGDLYGKNTIAGAINIITTPASDEADGKVEAQYGNYNLIRLRGYARGPIVKGVLSGKIAASYAKRDGFYKHLSGGEDLETLDAASFRGQLRFTPNDSVELILAGDALIDRGKPVFLQPRDIAFIDSPVETKPFVVDNNRSNKLDRDIWGIALTANVNIGDGVLTSISSYRKSSFDAQLDDDKTQFDFLIDIFSDDVDLYTQEVRYSGAVGNRFDYLLGLYYLNQKAKTYRPFALGDFFTGVPGLELPIIQQGSIDTESYAAFFSANHSLTDRLKLTVGGRYTSEDKNAFYQQIDQFAGLFPNITFNGKASDSAFSPTVSLSYDISDDVLAYARFARGFKSAGFNTDFAPSADGLQVKPEKATSYEAGIKSEFFDNRMRLNLAAFYTDYQDLQVSQVIGTAVLLSNAGQAKIKGFEAEIVARPNRYLDLDASLGYLDATYDDFPGCPPSLGSSKENCADNRIILAPKWTTSAGAQFTYPVGAIGDIVVRGDWHYQSKVFFDAQNTDRLSGNSHSIFNLRAGLATDQWEIYVWGENITDKLYVSFADDRSAIAVPLTQAYGTPRTYGVTVRVKW